MRSLSHVFWTLTLTACCAIGADAQDMNLHIDVLGPHASSPFKPQLLVHLSNESFVSTPLLPKMKTAQLRVDGKYLPMQETPFSGPAGLAPKSAWEGCVPVEHFAPQGLPPGPHRLQLNIGGSLSNEIRITIPRFEPPAATSVARQHQVETLADVIVPGRLRSCVEYWLPEPDGGTQSLDQTRYYVEPDVKVIVSYKEDRPEPRVQTRIQVYSETRILD